MMMSNVSVIYGSLLSKFVFLSVQKQVTPATPNYPDGLKLKNIDNENDKK